MSIPRDGEMDQRRERRRDLVDDEASFIPLMHPYRDLDRRRQEPACEYAGVAR